MTATKGLPPDFAASLKQAMSSAEDIACFLDEMDVSWLYNHPTDFIFKDLQELSAPCHRALELLLSYGVYADFLAEWLIDTFPSAANSAWDRSAHVHILRRLQDYLYFETSPLVISGDEQQALVAERTCAENTVLALKELDDMIFSPVSPRVTAFAKAKVTKTASRKNASQAERKREARRLNGQAPKNESIFDRLDVMRPEDQDEVDAMKEQFLISLQDLLRKCLVLLRSEAVSKYIHRSSVIKDVEHVQTTRPSLNLDTTQTGGVGSVKSPTSTMSYTQPMKAALYFDSASGHGQWDINISSRALADIRKAHKRNPKLFEIIMKKIKELSNAHFSDDNMKQLNKGENIVPVYEAKMTSDSRLVYQIDCVSEYHKDIGLQERQVIKIFGIYSHAQVNRLWDSLGFQLSGEKGREYRKRCVTRKVNFAGLCVPAVFPPNESSVGDVAKDFVPELPKEDLEEIHSILTLEKYITFSKELRNSILADLDVAHVFNMSPQEMEIVEHPYSCYVLGRSGTGKTTTMLFKMLGLERTFSTQEVLPDGRTKHRQLFVTQSRVLAGKVEEYFVKLMNSLEAGGKTDGELRRLAMDQREQASSSSEGDMYDEDDDVQWRSGLPKKFSLLTDEHFPLFLTFEKLAEMIIADLLDYKDMEKSPLRDMSSSSLLNYDRFLSEYWAHFPQPLTKSYDPALVFSEIIGVIKGSEKSLSCDGKHLDKESYLSLGERTNFAFASHRPTIFEIFLKYMQRKRDARDYDAADRTHRILEAIDRYGVPGIKVDFLYVDEAQDNMLIDAMLLRSICRSPLGLFWAGDTAQTISVGNSFRFEDLKSFLFRLEERRASEHEWGIQHAAHPTSFVLSTNYRSHGGIVACAHSIVELITHFWPDSLDKMAPEKGIVNGLKPFFFGNHNDGAVRFEDFLTGGKRVENIEFGARQCIIVRDEAARKRLRKRVGRSGTIMTLYDSKGLEFDDVLLCEFFTDSTVDARRWRVLFNCIDGKHAPAFDESRHAGLCSELKFLYVAITRARKKLWIYDSSDKSEPLRALWTHESLIENFEPSSTGELPQFVTASSRDEWKDQAKKFFKNKNYREAAQSFASAGMTREADIAAAYHLRKKAQAVLAPLKSRRQAFLDAGGAFIIQAGKSTTRETEVRVFYHNAAECFENAEAFLKAADAYRDAGEFDSALKLYRKEGKFDEGVLLLRQGAEKMDTALVENFKDVAKLFYLKDQEIEKAKELFDSAEETLEYLEDNPVLDESHALLLERLGRPIEAAQVHVNEGRMLDAVRVLCVDKNNRQALEQAHVLVMKGLWQLMPFGRPNHSEVEELHLAQFMVHAEELQGAKVVPKQAADEIKMFSAIRRGDMGQLHIAAQQFGIARQITPAILCLSHCFHPVNFPNIRKSDNVRVSHVLADLFKFCGILRTLHDSINPEDPLSQQLFGFQPSMVDNATVANSYFVPPGTWLHGRVVATVSGLDLTKGAVVTSNDIVRSVRDGICWYITDMIRHENHECHVTAAFTPCLRHVSTGFCHFGDGCYGFHVDAKDINRQWVTTQVRIHLQQVSLCQISESIPAHLGGGYGNRRYWIGRLHQTLYPGHYALGSWVVAEFSSIPEAFQASKVMRAWCRDLLDRRRGAVSNKELTLILQAAELYFHLDKDGTAKYIHTSPLIKNLSEWDIFHRETYDGKHRIYVLPELLASFDATNPYFIRKGILFVRHVVQKKLFIDINVLCGLVDFLCCASVAAHRRFDWHNVTLPRTWCMTLFRRLKLPSTRCDTTCLGILIDALQDILKVLCTGENAQFFLYGSPSIQPPRIRKLFVPRICRAMCIVGYNVSSAPLRHMIMEHLAPLQQTEPDRLFGRFQAAWTWDDISKEIWDASKAPLLDSDMVHLWSHHHPKPSPHLPPFTERVIFKSIQEIPYLLKAKYGAAPPPSHGKPDPGLKVTEQVISRVATPHPQEPSPEIDTGDQNIVTLDTSPLEVEEGVANATHPVDSVIPDEARLRAAEALWKIYAKLVRHRAREKSVSPRAAALRQVFKHCLEQSAKMEWPAGSVYKVYFLGIVPHLLVCVQWAQGYALTEKAAVKNAMKVAQHTELELAVQRQNRHKSISRATHELNRILRPESPFHVKRNLKELEKVAGEVESLLGDLPRTVADEVALDLAVAKKAFRKKREERAVQVEDDLAMPGVWYDDDA